MTEEIIMYTPKDVAAIMKYGEKKTRELMNSPAFPSIRCGRLIRVEKNAFEKWLFNNCGKRYII